MAAEDGRDRLPSETVEMSSLLSAEEFLGMDLPENEKWELLRGELVLNPAPSFQHQKVVKRLIVLIELWLERHPIGDLVQDWDVAFSPHETRRPDLIFRLKDSPRMEIGTHGRGTPDLIVEVLSPGQAHRDLGDKKDLYERCGVTEYLVVDYERRRLHHFTRLDGRYAEKIVTRGKLQIRVLAGLAVDLAALFAGLED